jgi:hypothetical protein
VTGNDERKFISQSDGRIDKPDTKQHYLWLSNTYPAYQARYEVRYDLSTPETASVTASDFYLWSALSRRRS